MALLRKRGRGPRHLVLLICILLLFTVAPFLLVLRHGVLILNIVTVGVMLAGTYTLSQRKHLFIVSLILSAIAVALTCWLLWAPSHIAMMAYYAAVAALIAFLAVAILAYVLRAGPVTADKMFAAICIYMLLGFGWTYGYALVDDLQPEAFTVPTPSDGQDYVGHLLQLRYFSFITLATVGYGDIAPRSAVARTMAVLEAVMGQLYLVVLVGRLVGLHIVHSGGSRSD